MSLVEQYRKLKSRATKLRREADRAEGVLEGVLKRLKEEFGVSSIKEARALLKKKEREERLARKAFAEHLALFEKRWGRFLK